MPKFVLPTTWSPKRYFIHGLLDGREEARTVGTPQGGVISPLLANLFLHYAFDRWMELNAPAIPFERYADDIVCHCYE